MSWSAHVTYKPSGVSWIGDIPDNWDVVSTRYLCNIGTGDKDTVNSDPDGEFPFFVRSQSVERISTWTFDAEAVLTAGDGAGVGKVFHYVDGKFDVHQRVYVFTNFRRVSGRYFFYYLSTLFAKVALDGSAKSTVDSLRRPMLTGFPVSFPGLVAQGEIVDFLDRETAKVDVLIAKQEQLIATLREDRTATITHAVTRGINPHDAPLKSGDQWLGDIVENWTRARIRDVVSSIESGVSVNGTDAPANLGAGEIGVLKTSCVSGGWFNPHANKAVFIEDVPRVACPVQEGQVVVNRANTPDLVGSAGYVAESVDGLYLSDLLWALKTEGVEPQFLYLWMQTPVYRTQVAAWRVGASASMQKISKASLRAFVIAIPPLQEQRRIVDFVYRRTAAIDRLISKSREVVEVLREYRSALITDAVTGKIDVQGAVA